MYRVQAGGTTYAFSTLKELLAKGSPPRSGDVLAGVAATSAAENVAAKMALADVPLKQFLNEVVVPYEEDDVTRLIVDTHDAAAFASVSHLTVGEFRDRRFKWRRSDSNRRPRGDPSDLPASSTQH